MPLEDPFEILLRTWVRLGHSEFAIRTVSILHHSEVGSLAIAFAFKGVTGPMLREAILNDSPPLPSQLNSKHAAKLRTIIDKALNKDREARYQSASDIRNDLESLKEATDRFVPGRMAAGGLVLLFLLAASFWVYQRSQLRPQVPHEPILTQLTVNSFENSVSSGAISPNGKYLAYADVKGLCVKTVATGETRVVSQPLEFNGKKVGWEIVTTGWFPDSTRFIANAHLIEEDAINWSSQTSSIWLIAAEGGLPTKLRDHAIASSVSRDGTSISFGTSNDREIWVMRSNGDQAKKFLESDENSSIHGLVWLPNSQRVSYFSRNESGAFLLSCDPNGGHPTRLLSEKEDGTINDLLWLPDGRLLYSLSKPGALFDWNYWALRIDPRTGQRAGKPNQLTNFKDLLVNSASVTADGKMLVFARWSPRMTSYVGDLARGGRRLLNVRHFPLSESSDGLGRWTPDSKTMLLVSNRTGKYALYKQPFDSQEPVGPLVLPPDGNRYANVTPDGKWILYLGYGKDSNIRLAEQPEPVMRASVDGGASQQLFIAATSSSIACSLSPSVGCAIAEPTEDRKQLIVSTLDPLKGRGPELARITLNPNGEGFFDLSADGNRIAFTRTPTDPIQILSTHGQPIRQVRVRGWSDVQEFTWAPDGKGLFVAATSVGGQAILYVDLEGNAYPLWENTGATGETLSYPSPDGKHLALQGWTASSNLWTMENF